MGAWGYGIWENDSNADALYEFTSDPSMRYLRDSLAEAERALRKRGADVQYWVGGLIALTLTALDKGKSDLDHGQARHISSWGKKHEAELKKFLPRAVKVLKSVKPKKDPFWDKYDPGGHAKQQAVVKKLLKRAGASASKPAESRGGPRPCKPPRHRQSRKASGGVKKGKRDGRDVWIVVATGKYFYTEAKARRKAKG